MSWTRDVATALGQHLAAAGAGTWRDTGVYTATETGIVLKVVPTAPDRVITITAYPVTESPTLSDVVLGMQVRCRAGRDPRDVDDMADTIRDVLHGARELVLGPAVLALVWRQSHAVLGPDANGRHETSSNFYAHTAQASRHVTD